MKVDLRNRLLEHFGALATDADTGLSAKVFLPLPQHQIALRPETVLVLGTRGAGKSALFTLIKDKGDKLARFFNDRSLTQDRWMVGFDLASPGQPAAPTVDAMARTTSSDAALRAFWTAHLLGRLVADGVAGAVVPPRLRQAWEGRQTQPEQWLGVAEENLGGVMAALDAVEAGLGQGEKHCFATYDALDRLGDLEPQHRKRLIRALLSLWLTLANRYRWLRAKIFLRPDLFDEAESGFADASKLRPRSTSLAWDVEALFRLVARHLANDGPSPSEARDWLLREVKGLRLDDRGEFGLMPSGMSEAARKSFASALAGELMGSGIKKGYTHNWIPARLKDAGGLIVPRSMLRLLSEAARHARREDRRRTSRSLIQPVDLVAALVETSRQRVTELREEWPVVARLANLEGASMLMDRAEVEERLGRRVGQDQLSRDGEKIFDELRRIGVLEQRVDGRVDVPDIYRYGYGIKRKGGARKPK